MRYGVVKLWPMASRSVRSKQPNYWHALMQMSL
jgi:hypothetical protein